MLLEEEIKIGKEYAYDIEGSLSTIHQGTNTVIIKEVEDNNILVVESKQTKEVFNCGRHMLTDIDRLKEMYNNYQLKEEWLLKDMDKFAKLSYKRKRDRIEEIFLELDLKELIRKEM